MLMDSFLMGTTQKIALIRRAASISIEKHDSRIIAVVGHYDCAGNPVTREHHYMHVRIAMLVSSFAVTVTSVFAQDAPYSEEYMQQHDGGDRPNIYKKWNTVTFLPLFSQIIEQLRKGFVVLRVTRQGNDRNTTYL